MPASATSVSLGVAPPSANAALRHLVRGEALWVPPSASVRETLLRLDAAAADAIVVVDPQSRVPLGIVTLRDVLHRIAIEAAGAAELDAPVAGVMTAAPICVPADTTLHQAGVLMARRGVHHLVLTGADGRYLNVVAQADLYAVPGARAGELVAAILAAKSVAALAALAAEIRGFAGQLLAERVGAEAICQRISALNDLLAVQLIDIVAEGFELPYVPWCWLVFGSEGRLEQTLSTDQDNGLIFAAESPADAARLRAAFLPFARAVNDALDACGFTLCKGGIMAGNEAWCLSADEWRQAFGEWMRKAEPQALLNSTIFFDFRPLYGQDVLAGELRDWLLARAPNHPIFLRALVGNTLAWASPLGWWQGFRYDAHPQHPHTIDLKLHGARPFVDAARIYALAHGVPDTNTVERLRAVAARDAMPAHEAAAFVDAFQHIQRLRLEHQLGVGHEGREDRAGGEGGGASNRVDPDRLHELDRLILRESLKQARSLQQRLARDYSLA